MSALRDDLRQAIAGAPDSRPHDPSAIASHETEAAVLVPLYEEDGELHAVFTKRREDLRRHPGEISFPGGRRDHEHEHLHTTALREAEEEIGLEPAQVQMLGTLTPVRTFVTGYVIFPYVGLIEAGNEWTLSEAEVDVVLELPLRRLIEGFAVRPMTRRGLTFDTGTYVVDDHLIWGATARILGDLLTRVTPVIEP